VACRNPDLAARRKSTRQSLLDATDKELQKVQAMISRGYLKTADKIGVRVGKVINRYKMAKHFKLDIAENHFSFEIDEANVNEEAALDGIYVIRSSLTGTELSAEEAVRHYKALSQVERAFRSMKTMDLEIRPIRHYQENRVRTHLLICMLAYYVKWHMVEAWRPLLFADEDQRAKQSRDPVAQAKRSDAALAKISSKRLPDGTPAHSFQSLLSNLATIVRNSCRRQGAELNEACFTMDTTPSSEQATALQLLGSIKM
jgi:transposase